MRYSILGMGRSLGLDACLFLACLLAISASGCSTTLPSPPGRMLHLTTPKSVGKGRGEVTAAFGTAHSGGFFEEDLGVMGGEVHGRYGLSERTDIGLSAFAAGLRGDEDVLLVSHHRGIYAARLSLHHELVPRFVALQVGFAGGGSAAGGFVSPDAGITLGYENPHLVPYAYGSFYFSQPIAETTLDMSTEDSPNDLRTPYPSFGPRAGLGLRVPIGPRVDPHSSLLLELGGTWMYGDDPAEEEWLDGQRAFLQFGLAYRLHLGRKARAPAD